MRDRVVYLQRPSFVRDDTTNASLDLDKANDGMVGREMQSRRPKPTHTARSTASRFYPQDG